MSLVYVALGSNLGVPESQLAQAVMALKKLPFSQNLKLSRWYKSAAIGGPVDQPDYINAACSFDTQLKPEQLLKALQNIENLAGRTREVRWGPRTLDLDIIWYEGFQSQSSLLSVPHPRAHERAFVLRPLKDLAANFELTGKPLEHWLKQTAEQRIEPIAAITDAAT